jgi:hypothetical protein
MRGALLLVLLLGCEPPDDPPPEPRLDAGVELGPMVACDDPVEGPQRLTEEAETRGLVGEQASPAAIGLPAGSLGGGLIVEDLDGDGDLDVLSVQITGDLRLHRNDGHGRFELLPSPWPAGGIASMAIAQGAVDLDGDGLPELLMGALGSLTIASNLGDLSFGPRRDGYRPPGQPTAQNTTLSWGDVDGDGDLDVILPTLLTIDLPPGVDVGAPDALLINEDGDFTLGEELVAGEEPGMTFLAVFTDRDLDGDADLFAGSEGGHYGLPPNAFWRNDGVADGAPVLVDDAEEVGADLFMSAMGLATRDLNGDGLPDYCMTDLGPLRCLLSDGGRWAEGGASLGLEPDWEGPLMLWSVEMEDLDNDGRPEAFAAGGWPGPSATGPQDLRQQKDVLWWANEDGYEDVSAALGFDDRAEHYGLAAGDVDGDGALDIVIVGSEGTPKLWMNRCSAGGWLEIDLVGPPGNGKGYGARVEVTTGDRIEPREVMGPRAYGQSPARLHYGLGDVDVVDSLRVTWPDGTVQDAFDVAPRRIVTVRHPGG